MGGKLKMVFTEGLTITQPNYHPGHSIQKMKVMILLK